jgi:hypothetical protein
MDINNIIDILPSLLAVVGVFVGVPLLLFGIPYWLGWRAQVGMTLAERREHGADMQRWHDEMMDPANDPSLPRSAGGIYRHDD